MRLLQIVFIGSREWARSTWGWWHFLIHIRCCGLTHVSKRGQSPIEAHIQNFNLEWPAIKQFTEVIFRQFDSKFLVHTSKKNISTNWDSEETLRKKADFLSSQPFLKRWARQRRSSHFGTDLLRHGKTIIGRRRWQACRHDGSLWIPFVRRAFIQHESHLIEPPQGTRSSYRGRQAGRLPLAASQSARQWRHSKPLLNHIRKYTLIGKRKHCTRGTDVIWVSLLP